MTPSEYRKKVAEETEKARARNKGIRTATGDLEKAIKYARAGAKAGSMGDKFEKGVYGRKDEGR